MQAPLTELEAVNDMLLAIGQAPVNSFSATILDQTVARAELAKIVREVCLHGFRFNTDDEYELSPNSEGIILVPDGAMRVDPSDPAQRLVDRQHPDGFRALWDQANLTWEMSEAVKCRIFWSLDFDALPESARSYAVAAASRKFQARTVGDATLDRFNAEDQARAWATLIRDDAAQADRNIFKNSSELRQKTTRRRRGGTVD